MKLDNVLENRRLSVAVILVARVVRFSIAKLSESEEAGAARATEPSEAKAATVLNFISKVRVETVCDVCDRSRSPSPQEMPPFMPFVLVPPTRLYPYSTETGSSS